MDEIEYCPLRLSYVGSFGLNILRKLAYYGGFKIFAENVNCFTAMLLLIGFEIRQFGWVFNQPLLTDLINGAYVAEFQ